MRVLRVLPMVARLVLPALVLQGWAVPGPAAAEGLAKERLPTCLACHGEKGLSPTAEIPSLGAQPADYLLVQLVLFREKQRLADPMNAMADGLSDDDLRSLSDEVSKLPAPPPGQQADASLLAKGHDLTAKYRCNSCHGANFEGQEQIPRLAGQHEAYLAKALTAYKSNARAGYDPAMNEVAQEIQPADIPVLAAYLAGYKP